MSHDDFEAYLRLTRGGMTPGHEQIYNFLKVDGPRAAGYEIRCKDINRLVFGDAGRRESVGCSNTQFVNRGENMQCVHCSHQVDKFYLRAGSYIETHDIPPDT
ncbi:SubName: Full=Uncharacterized protein {ECO:0000313/EMBL:CCA75577.1} [Serendipita indica DSM 11827]|uniref:Uncharacterized protein n=1 Tax=Serendipita indica (strain DSM 11827) TaxID=1109443 RepID=G4TW84_SERID|nr:SubName: Full=Uncharacterized protein {ECO:0000313/EMBL:CCA75577.1} [Serendipita indica DSM 11827]CCA75577.1 hypothetical protein PIIN_09567 [Serendipita indica DSM 11827]